MTTLPEHTVTVQDLVEWEALTQQLKRVKAAEMLLRMKIFHGFFPHPVEGTNDVPLQNGYVLKAKYPITREVDNAAFQVLAETLRGAGIFTDKMVQYKPSLVKGEYNKLTEDQRHLFDQCLIVKPGSPALEIVLPAKARTE